MNPKGRYPVDRIVLPFIPMIKMLNEAGETAVESEAQSLEKAFIIGCLRGRWDPEALTAVRPLSDLPNFSWDKALATARRERVAQLLYTVLKESDWPPPPFMAQLRAIYFRTAKNNILTFRELAALLTRLNEAGIAVIVLKGAALAEAVYGNRAVRPMVDVDLLVRPEDVPVALQVVKGLDYKIAPPLAYRAEVMAVKTTPISTLTVEIHWGLFVAPQYWYAFPAETLWRSALPLAIDNAPALMLAAEAQLLHLCGHLLLHHPGETYRWLWLHDIAETIMANQAQLDWSLVRRYAVQLGLETPVWALLHSVVERWRLPAPPPLQRWGEACGQPIGATLLEPAGDANWPRMMADIWAIRGLRHKAAFIWRNLFPPFNYMREIYDIQRTFFVPFAYPYRWFLGLRGWWESR
jgi:hypothetical protein